MMQSTRHQIAALFVILASVGCTKKVKPAPSQDLQIVRTGQVDHVVENVPDDERYKRLPGMTYIPAAPLDNKKPIYPPSLLDRRLPPIKVSVAIIVDDQGVVTSINPTNNDGIPQEFVDATVEAIKTWGFAPLEKYDGDKYEQLPYSETYTFEFKQIDGVPVVE